MLGQISGKYCDTVYVTEEDPRDESVAQISEMILSGMEHENGVVIEDRYKAIEAAITGAKTGDCVLILGKGDETYMYHKDGRVPWMGDHEAAKKVLNEMK